jgi:hypothetical protein
VRLTEPQGITADNEFTFRLPSRSPIIIAADEALPVALRLALAASPARLVKPDDPSANVRAVLAEMANATLDKPSVTLVDDGPPVAKGTAVRVTAGSLAADGLDLEHAVCDAGPAIRASERSGGLIPLLEAGDAVLAALDVSNAKAGRLLVSRAIFGRDSTVANRPAFAILLSRAVRQLAGWDPLPRSLPADRAVVDPVWLYHTSATAGPEGVIVAPGDREGSDLGRDESMAAAQPGVEPAAGRLYAVSQLMLLFALILLLVETALHARGRIV